MTSLITTTDITFSCEDGYTLSGSLFSPQVPAKGAVMIAPATGIKRQFYARFASFLAEQGYGVITFDNRGIGQSLQGNISKSDASLQCWGELDMPAALNHLQQLFPGTNYHLVGHSAGGQLVGLMQNSYVLKSMYNIACSSGQLRNMEMPYYAKANFFMNLVIPVSNFLVGHTKSQLFGMGEPLPKRAAAQWREWCNGQGYVKTAFGRSVTTHNYDQLTLPALWAYGVDDEIANAANVADMISVFSQSPATTYRLCPTEHGLSEIGHMKFFSRKSQVLWPHVIEWIEQHS